MFQINLVRSFLSSLMIYGYFFVLIDISASARKEVQSVKKKRTFLSVAVQKNSCIMDTHGLFWNTIYKLYSHELGGINVIEK